MRRDKILKVSTLLVLVFLLCPTFSRAWHDETHIAIAKAAGYHKWFNATGADMAKLKAGDIERHNRYVNNSPATKVTPEMVLDQSRKYNQIDKSGHLYGAIIASLRDYSKEKKQQETLRLSSKISDLDSLARMVSAREGLAEQELRSVSKKREVVRVRRLFC